MAIRAVLFDATGTLIEPAEQVGATYSRVAADFGVSLPGWRLTDAFVRVLRHAAPRVFPGADPDAAEALEREWWQELVRQTFQATDSTAHFADFQGFFAALWEVFARGEAWQLRPGVRRALDALRAEGLVLGIVSNFDHRLPRILDELGIGGLFDVVALPSGHGAAKPEPALFEAALEALHTSADQTLYVGDDPENDLAGARAAGLHFCDARELAELGAHPTRIAGLATLGNRPGHG
jgi:putative hydrolase of the HAD superfamily